jgi:hypothetical protein
MQLVICPKCSEAVPIEKINDHLSKHLETNFKVEEHETKSAGG